jgi:hypothetical protein
MGLRALERRSVLFRAFFAVREEVDRYLDLAERRRRLPNPVDLKEAVRKRGLDPPGLFKAGDYLRQCREDGVTPDRDDLVCRILGMEDCWISRAIEDSTPDELRKGPTKAQRAAAAAHNKRQVRELMQRDKREKEDLLRKLRETQAQIKATAAPAKADPAAPAKADPAALFALQEQIGQALTAALEGMRREAAGRTE